MTCDEFLMAVLEPKGTPTPAEKAALDAHAAGCKECAEVLEALPVVEEGLRALPREIPLSEATQKRILDDMHLYLREEKVARARGERRWARVLLVLAFLTLLALAFIAGRLTAPFPKAAPGPVPRTDVSASGEHGGH